MNQGEDGDTDTTLDRVEIDVTVREIFDGVFDGPMEQFNEPLEFIKENKFRAVWREDTERREKVTYYAKTFLQAVTTTLLISGC